MTSQNYERKIVNNYRTSLWRREFKSTTSKSPYHNTTPQHVDSATKIHTNSPFAACPNAASNGFTIKAVKLPIFQKAMDPAVLKRPADESPSPPPLKKRTPIESTTTSK